MQEKNTETDMKNKLLILFFGIVLSGCEIVSPEYQEIRLMKKQNELMEEQIKIQEKRNDLIRQQNLSLHEIAIRLKYINDDCN